MFDLESLALSDDAFELQLTHPVSGEPLSSGKDAVAIFVYGSASEQYRQAANALQLKSIRRGKKQPSPAETKVDTVELFAACSKSSKNLAYKGKEVLTNSDFVALYSDPKFSWILEQVATAIGDPANFLSKN